MEIKACGESNRDLEAMGLGGEEIRMDTEFRTYRGDHEDALESV